MATLLMTPPTDVLDTSNFWRVSVERYHDMIAKGILTTEERLELLEGLLIKKMTVNPPHAFVTQTIDKLFARLLSDNLFVVSQEPITMADSEPEPDVFVVRGKRRDFVRHHPTPKDVALVVEVSDATLQQDRVWKQRIYANAEIPAYWIVNLPDRQIEVYTDPSGMSDNPVYRQRILYQEGDELPVMVDGVATAVIPVRDLLP